MRLSRNSIIGLCILILVAYVKRRWMLRQIRKIRARLDKPLSTFQEGFLAGYRDSVLKVFEYKGKVAPKVALPPRGTTLRSSNHVFAPKGTIANLIDDAPRVHCGVCGEHSGKLTVTHGPNPHGRAVEISCGRCHYLIRDFIHFGDLARSDPDYVGRRLREIARRFSENVHTEGTTAHWRVKCLQAWQQARFVRAPF